MKNNLDVLLERIQHFYDAHEDCRYHQEFNDGMQWMKDNVEKYVKQIKEETGV